MLVLVVCAVCVLCVFFFVQRRCCLPEGDSGADIGHEMSFRFERKSIDYADAYFSGDASDPIVAKVFLRGKKEYRSHRGIPPSEYTGQVAKPWSKKRRKKC